MASVSDPKFRVDYTARNERLAFNYAVNVSLEDASLMVSHIMHPNGGGHEHDASEITSVTIKPMD